MDADLPWDIHAERVGRGFAVPVSDRMMRRTVTALNNLLRTGSRELPQDDFATFACLRDVLAQVLASGKPYEGRLAEYE